MFFLEKLKTFLFVFRICIVYCGVNAYFSNDILSTAKHVGSKLRAGEQGATGEELERMLDKVMILFSSSHGELGPMRR